MSAEHITATDAMADMAVEFLVSAAEQAG